VQEILGYLKKHPGEQLDSDIAKGVGLSLKDVRQHVTELARRGEVMTCVYTKFENGKRIEGWLCRPSGYIPPKPPGRKPSK
jgi:predicted ArsR family transcriptional regulator